MGTFFCVGQDQVVSTLKTELNRNFDVLKNEPIPVYYISVRVDEIQSIGTLGRLGRLQSPRHAEFARADTEHLDAGGRSRLR